MKPTYHQGAIIINLESTFMDNMAVVVFLGKAGVILPKRVNQV